MGRFGEEPRPASLPLADAAILTYRRVEPAAAPTAAPHRFPPGWTAAIPG